MGFGINYYFILPDYVLKDHQGAPKEEWRVSFQIIDRAPHNYFFHNGIIFDDVCTSFFF